MSIWYGANGSIDDAHSPHISLYRPITNRQADTLCLSMHLTPFSLDLSISLNYVCIICSKSPVIAIVGHAHRFFFLLLLLFIDCIACLAALALCTFDTLAFKNQKSTNSEKNDVKVIKSCTIFALICGVCASVCPAAVAMAVVYYRSTNETNIYTKMSNFNIKHTL